MDRGGPPGSSGDDRPAGQSLRVLVTSVVALLVLGTVLSNMSFIASQHTWLAERRLKTSPLLLFQMIGTDVPAESSATTTERDTGGRMREGARDDHHGESGNAAWPTAVVKHTSLVTEQPTADVPRTRLNSLPQETRRAADPTTRVADRPTATLGGVTMAENITSELTQRVLNDIQYPDGIRALLLNASEGVRQRSRAARMAGGAPGGWSCVKGSTRLKTINYPHRRRRPGEYTPQALLSHLLGQEGAYTAVAVLHPTIPPAANPMAVGFSGRFPLTVPFGGWATYFVPDRRDIKPGMGVQLTDEQPPSYVAFLRHAIAHKGYVSHPCSGTAYTTGGCMWEPGHVPPSMLADAAKGVDDPLDSENADGLRSDVVPRGVVVCDSWCKGYFHFSHEHLPRIALAASILGGSGGFKLVLSHAPNGFQRQYYSDIFGLDVKRDVVYGTQRVAVAGYPVPMRCGNTFTHALYVLRRVVYDRLQFGSDNVFGDLAAVTLAPSKGREAAQLSTSGRKFNLLFAERSKGSRMPSNYKDVKQRIVDAFSGNFTITTTLGTEHVTTQIRQFYNADLVIGPHGANLANAMYMRRGAHVVEIQNRKKGNMCYYVTCSRINVTHHLIHHSGESNSFTIEYDELHKHVEHALRILRSYGQLGGTT